jgi:GNAT superfamily N-acetyltransferase
MSPINVREATAADNEALLELERSAPLDLGDVEIVLDRSPDYFASLSLQEDARVMVAEEGGRLVGVCAAARHCAPLMGEPRALLYIEKGRTLPEYRRQRVSSVLIWALVESWSTRGRPIDSAYWLIAANNNASLTAVRRGGALPWPVKVHLVDLPADATRTEATTVRLGPERAEEVIALLNRTHAGKEMFAPYTEERLDARLSRTPRYDWQNWWGLEGEGGRLSAVVGLLDLGRLWRTKVRVKASGEETTSSAASVFDFGYADGGEGKMMELLDQLSGIAASWGRDHVAIHLDPRDGLYPFLPATARVGADFRLFATGLAVPSADEMGRVYLDPVYL